ncbi:MAG TPA: hypothetical protein VE996_13110 [Terriglobales bacterium]|nr:hypothetical protein [Terriglobales bacterium]
MTDNMRLDQLRRFYALLGRLEQSIGGERYLAECSGRMKWPQRGVYFFREKGEARSDSGNGPRIVRVGTHALKAGAASKLWTRLARHKGNPSTGGGNHRGSIFRLIVGLALAGRYGYDIPTWGRGKAAKGEIRAGELTLEKEVSAYIGKMPFIWLAVGDDPGPESLRGYVERNAIALLSNYDRAPLDPPSKTWLGYCCNRERVRGSGLWNQNHVDGACAPDFLDRFEQLIAATGGA